MFWNSKLVGRFPEVPSWLDDQQVANNLPSGLPGVDMLVANAGRSHRYGVELETHWQASDEWSFYGNAAYLKTEFDDLILNGLDRSGDSFPNAPEWTCALGVDYRHPSGFFGNLNFTWADATHALASDPGQTRLEPRSLLNAKLGWAWERASVYLFGANLLDDDYALYRSIAVPPVIPQVGKAGPERTFGVGVELRW